MDQPADSVDTPIQAITHDINPESSIASNGEPILNTTQGELNQISNDQSENTTELEATKKSEDTNSQQKPVETTEKSATGRQSAELNTSNSSATAQKPGQWSNYFKKALNNVESSLDKMLAESSETANQNVRQTASVPSAPSRPSTPGTRSRLTMQERLAMAVGRTSSDNSSLEKRSSADSTRTVSDSSKVNLEESVEKPDNGLDEPLRIKLVVSDSTDGPSLSQSTALIDQIAVATKDIELDESSTICSLLKKLRLELEEQEKHLSQYVHYNAEKADSLESKLKYLAHQEVERAGSEKLDRSGLNKKLAEKDEQIALLFEEGQMMSKKELKHMNTIKKLRAQELESRKQMESALVQKVKAEKEALISKEKLTRQAETIKGLSKTGSDNESIRKERDQLRDRSSALEQELKELRSKYDQNLLEAQSAALEEANAKVNSLMDKLSKSNTEHEAEEMKLNSEITQLRSDLKKEVTAGRKLQAELKEEIKNLEARVEFYRSRAEEAVSGSVSESNAAILRQIETLNTQHSIANENWHSVESRLLIQISELEASLEQSKTSESYLRKKLKTLNENHRVGVAENEKLIDQLQELQSDHLKATSELRSWKVKFEDATDASAELRKQFTEEKDHLQAELTSYGDKLAETELQLKDANAKLAMIPTSPILAKRGVSSSFDLYSLTDSRAPSSPYERKVSGFDSTNVPFGNLRSSSTSIDQLSDTDYDDGLRLGRNHRRKPSIADSIEPSDAPGDGSPEDSSAVTASASVGPSIQLIGKMNNAIRRLESELMSKSQELERITNQKDEACQRVAELMKEQEGIADYQQKVVDLESQITALEKREQTTLEMLGEKSELVNELRADVDDIKTAYKQQIEQLVDQLASAVAKSKG